VLDALVAEATTDAYNEGEQIVGFLTLIDEAGRAADAAREVNGAVVACWLI
jgi:hypothetical protein